MKDTQSDVETAGSSGIFGGARVWQMVVPVVVAIALLAGLSALGIGVFPAALITFALAITCVVAYLWRREGSRSGLFFAIGGVVALVVAWFIGWSGVLTFRDDLQWGGLSAVVAVFVASVVGGIALRLRPRVRS